jgi:hypothetical protein
MLESSFRTSALVALAVACAVGFSPARCALAGQQAAAGAVVSQARADVTLANIAPAAEQSAAQAPTAVKHGVRARVRVALRRLNPMRLVRNRQYKKAAAAFPAFCKHWQSLLHEREVYNLGRIQWVPKDGYQTGTYTGYSTIETCSCKQSDQGFAIGKLTYDEFTYYVAGKTADEARLAKPRPIAITLTTELFRWDHGKWFY